MKSVLGGTVNDVVLTVIAGGMGRYLRALGLPTDGVELRAMCPVSMRRPDERGALGNLVSMIFAPLHVGVLDPVARLAAEREAMDAAQGPGPGGRALRDDAPAGPGAPRAGQAVAGQLTVPEHPAQHRVSTNVPGPADPALPLGARLIGWCPLLPLASEVGLVNAILTYDQRLTIGVTVDPRLVPDVWLYVECLKASFAELLDATDAAETAGTGAPSPPPRQRSPSPFGGRPFRGPLRWSQRE